MFDKLFSVYNLCGRGVTVFSDDLFKVFVVLSRRIVGIHCCFHNNFLMHLFLLICRLTWTLLKSATLTDNFYSENHMLGNPRPKLVDFQYLAQAPSFLWSSHRIFNQVARDAVLKFRPHISITPYHANVKDPDFNVDFFKQFNVVLNGLDNLDARRHVNRLCLAAEVPLVESGTTGFLGQVIYYLYLFERNHLSYTKTGL